ncbi:MAG: hypothetical protein GVY26_14995 [Bacteroidetes bacterium]|jgi:predicted DsbA family dithiol-disulfide isomerase|nr:hypothetical protein [Bacteroidota bacterium]
MNKRSVKRRLIKARIALNHTIQKILDINRNRKRLTYSRQSSQREEIFNEELRVLNKMAENQARLVRHYENTLISTSSSTQTAHRAPQQERQVVASSSAPTTLG